MVRHLNAVSTLILGSRKQEELTQQAPLWSAILGEGFESPVLLRLVRYTNLVSDGSKKATFCRLTASPQNGIRPMKQKSAPKASALKISEPRRIPPSTAIGIRPLAIGAQTRRASSVDGMPSSWRPPWLEMTTPLTLYLRASSISSGVVTICHTISGWSPCFTTAMVSTYHPWARWAMKCAPSTRE